MSAYIVRGRRDDVNRKRLISKPSRLERSILEALVVWSLNAVPETIFLAGRFFTRTLKRKFNLPMQGRMAGPLTLVRR